MHRGIRPGGGRESKVRQELLFQDEGVAPAGKDFVEVDQVHMFIAGLFRAKPLAIWMK